MYIKEKNIDESQISDDKESSELY